MEALSIVHACKNQSAKVIEANSMTTHFKAPTPFKLQICYVKDLFVLTKAIRLTLLILQYILLVRSQKANSIWQTYDYLIL